MKPRLHRTREEKLALVSRILRHALTRDFKMKDMMYDHGICITHAHHILNELHYRHMVVSEEERRIVLRLRNDRAERVVVPPMESS